MAFINHKTKDFIISESMPDDGYIYLSSPSKIRVHKESYQIQKLVNGKYIPVHITTGGMKGHYYPAFYADNQLWNAVRLIATLFVPNPNGYNFICRDDNSLNPKSLRWTKTPARFEESNACTLVSDRSKLEGLKGKEYYDVYNKIKGSDGLTNAERFRLRMKAKGYKIISKKFSPTGRRVWVPEDLRVKIHKANIDGSISKPEVKQQLINEILALPRIKKAYKDVRNLRIDNHE